MAKRYNSAGISKHMSYTVAEIADITGITEPTIRRRINLDGLPAMTSQKPTLIHGADWIAFNNAKRKSAKKPLKPGELLCMKCGPKLPFGAMADYVDDGYRPRLSGLCGACERPVSLIISAAQLIQYRAVLDIAGASPL